MMTTTTHRLVSILILCLAGILMALEWLRRTAFPIPIFNQVRNDLINHVLSRADQRIMVLCLALWCLALTWLSMQNDCSKPKPRSKWLALSRMPDYCRVLLIAWSVLIYAFVNTDNVQEGSFYSLLLGIDQSTNILVLLVGAILSQAVGYILNRTRSQDSSFSINCLAFFVVFLTATSWIQSAVPHEYMYHGQSRWTGLWVNPNIFGILMGVGFVLALGMPLSITARSHSGISTIWRRRLKRILFLIFSVIMIVGLLRSYSRGAWVASICGLTYLGFHAITASGFQDRPACRWLQRNWAPLALIIIAVLGLASWQLRNSGQVTVRRVFSVGNANDFSWRNRIVAWEGAWQMVVDRPLYGYGWNQPEPNFEQYYRPLKVEEGMAIQLNDYFTLGTTMGMPALAFFIGFVVLRLKGGNQTRKLPANVKKTPPVKHQDLSFEKLSVYEQADWPKVVCRAGVIVLLVGFWFDGGLFKLATAVPFWILLELGAAKDDACECSNS